MVGGGPDQKTMPLCGSILQAESCQILSLAENPRWSPSVAIIYFCGFKGLDFSASKFKTGIPVCRRSGG